MRGHLTQPLREAYCGRLQGCYLIAGLLSTHLQGVELDEGLGNARHRLPGIGRILKCMKLGARFFDLHFNAGQA
jgi:hypothetical protein